jgi:ankyrin repeat protein
MDPLSAIGLAASIVQFIQFGLVVVNRLEEFNSKNPGDVPKSLQAISTQLPLLLNALGRINSESNIKNLDFDTKCILRGMVSGCQQQIVEIERMINEISKAPGDSFKLKIKKVFISLKYDEKVWGIERNLHTYISVLILHHVIDSSDAPPEIADDTFFDVREKRISEFIDRPNLIQELDDQLREAVWSQTKNPTILLLAGNRGVGKTQLALEYCYQAHSLGQFKTVFWVDASSLENLSLGFESIYATVRRSTDGSRKEKIGFVTSFLNDLWHPWLLVLDDYESSELYNNIMEFLPTRGSGGILLISQTQENGLGKVLRVPKFIAMEDQNRLNNKLIQAVQSQDVEGIKTIVGQGADVNTLIWNEWPCLHRAALFGLEDAVAFLLERGANPNPALPISKPLYWAASNGNEAVCRLLLDHEDKTGETLSPTDYQSAFNAAAKEGKLEVMRMISSRKEVRLNDKNSYDETPLQTAAKNGHVEVVEFLLDQGVLNTEYTQGKQALISAASKGSFEIVELLCSKEKIDPNVQDNQGRTPLCSVAGLQDERSYKESGVDMKIMEFLLKCGADPNLFGKCDGPIHTAAIKNHVDKIRLLLDHGADPIKDANGWCPLTNAIKYKSPEALAVLLEAKVPDATARQESLDAALRYAARSGERSAVMELLKAGADINAFSDKGFPKRATPLLLAVLSNEVKTAQFLIRQGANQDLPDSTGRLPLPVAAENGHELLVRDLIRGGGKPNMKSGENEDTPLILAAAKGHEKVVKVLLQFGADPMATNNFGDVALDVAEEKDFKKVIELLEGVNI